MIRDIYKFHKFISRYHSYKDIYETIFRMTDILRYRHTVLPATHPADSVAHVPLVAQLHANAHGVVHVGDGRNLCYMNGKTYCLKIPYKPGFKQIGC